MKLVLFFIFMVIVKKIWILVVYLSKTVGWFVWWNSSNMQFLTISAIYTWHYKDACASCFDQKLKPEEITVSFCEKPGPGDKSAAACRETGTKGQN
jgi:hypothetical protein